MEKKIIYTEKTNFKKRCVGILDEEYFYFLVKKYDIVNVSWKDVLDVYEGKIEDFQIAYRKPYTIFIKNKSLKDFFSSCLESMAEEYIIENSTIVEYNVIGKNK